MGWKKGDAHTVRIYRKRWFVAFLLGLSVVAGLALWSACIRYAPFEESRPNSIVSVFSKRVDDAVLNHNDVRVVYHTGQTDGRSIDYWFSGMIEVFSPDAFVEGEDDQGCGGDRGDGSGIEGDVLEGLEVLDQGVGPLGGSPH